MPILRRTRQAVSPEASEKDKTMEKVITADLLMEAFTAVPATPTDRAIMRAYIENPDATAAELSAKTAWGDDAESGLAGPFNLHSGKMHRNREHILGPAPVYPDDWTECTGVFVHCVRSDKDSPMRFTLTDAAEEAFHAILASEDAGRAAAKQTRTVVKAVQAKRKIRRGVGSY
jgi:hypothetical protein